MDSKKKFNWLTAAYKAAVRTISPAVVAGGVFFLSNPQVLNLMLGKWKEITMAQLVVFGCEMARNYLKNK